MTYKLYWQGTFVDTEHGFRRTGIVRWIVVEPGPQRRIVWASQDFVDFLPPIQFPVGWTL